MKDVKSSYYDEVIGQLIYLWRKPTIRHGLMWIGLLGFVLLLNYRSDAAVFTLINSVILLAFYYLIIRINFEQLIPRYLNKKKILTYLLVLGLIAALLAPLRSLTTLISISTFAPHFEYEFSSGSLGVFVSMLIVGLVSTALRVFSDWLKHNRVKAEMSKQQMTSELNFLRSQVNPHFLFNTLNSLYALTLKKSDEAPEIVIKLSEMMRYMLYECNETYVPLEKEIKYLQNYIELERLRHGDHIEITLTLKGDAHDREIAPLLFVPFIENSFKHGLGNRIDVGFVRIRLSIEDDHLAFEVTNSKNHQIKPSGLQHTGGIGLVNVRRRLNLIYPDQHDLLISDHQDTFSISLHINLRHHD